MTKIKTIQIDSLSKYINQINKLDGEYYYRGENKRYSVKKASAFRPYQFTWDSGKPFPFEAMIDEFYKEVAYKLNEDKVDFIAFAQHHGLPTNLLDVSTSPLTSLYFACQGEWEDEGIVYLANPAYIDVTELVHKYPNENLLEKVFSNSIRELNLLVPVFEKFYSENEKVFMQLLKRLKESYIYYFRSSLDEKENQFYRILNRKKSELYECIYYLREIDDSYKQFSLDNCSQAVYFYLLLQYHFFRKARAYTETIHIIDFLPNMIYRPIIKFERGRNQHGLFLYQGYMTYIEPMYNFRVLMLQDLSFQNIEFHIKNKKKILEELDRIDINKKTLFCDYDSVAAYIKEKYDKDNV